MTPRNVLCWSATVLAVFVLDAGFASVPATATDAPVTTIDIPPNGAVAEGREADPATLTGEAARGIAVYAANCSGCHGVSGRGGRGVPRLANYRVRQAKAVKAIVRPGSGMPALYPGTLSAQDVADVAEFVRNFPKN